MDLSEAMTEVRRLNPAYSLEVGGHWRSAASMDEAAVAEIVSDHARARAIPVGRYAASLLFQRYCHRLAPVALGTWVLSGQALDMSQAHISVCFRDGSPVGVLHSGAMRPVASAKELVTGLIDEHLEDVARLIHAGFRISLPNLRGNMAASIGMAASTLSRIRPAAEVKIAAQQVLACRPWLERMGEFRILVGPRGPRLFYDRRTCCHWYTVPDGSYCSYCSLLNDEERTRRYIAAMESE